MLDTIKNKQTNTQTKACDFSHLTQGYSPMTVDREVLFFTNLSIQALGAKRKRAHREGTPVLYALVCSLNIG